MNKLKILLNTTMIGATTTFLPDLLNILTMAAMVLATYFVEKFILWIKKKIDEKLALD